MRGAVVTCFVLSRCGATYHPCRLAARLIIRVALRRDLITRPTKRHGNKLGMKSDTMIIIFY